MGERFAVTAEKRSCDKGAQSLTEARGADGIVSPFTWIWWLSLSSQLQSAAQVHGPDLGGAKVTPLDRTSTLSRTDDDLHQHPHPQSRPENLHSPDR